MLKESDSDVSKGRAAHKTKGANFDVLRLNKKQSGPGFDVWWAHAAQKTKMSGWLAMIVCGQAVCGTTI